MHSNRTEIHAHREPWLCDNIALRIVSVSHNDGVRTVALAEPLMMKVKTDEELYSVQPATVNLRPDEAQQLMDELWRVGIKPTSGAGSVGQMAATEKHLEDMRRLVFGPAKP